MKNIVNIVLIILSVFSLASCENDIDNYDAPNGGIRGTIYDAETNEPIPLPTQGASGVLVNLYEQNTNATKSVDFRAKQDGTYENSQIFNCEYKIVVNGPFVDKCEGTVNVNGQTQFDLTAIPFSRVDIQANIDASNKVQITYSAVPSSSAYTVSEVTLLWNFAPGVDINSSNYATKSASTESAGNYVFDLTSDKSFIDNLYKIVANGGKIYVRVAANVNGNINYSKVLELQINQ